ncbi:MAG TPA: Nramp family divalent metal transporter [Limnochordia bacterium]|nr:Nramp family divalent metal transporter [Limnochordia bacterium]
MSEGMSRRAEAAAREALGGQRRGWRAVVPFMGPAFVAAVAYLDPGNYATNIQSGAQFGYKLLWVVLLANLMAMLIQTLSAKLGIATGKNLAELCGETFSAPVRIAMWVVSEVAAMATDLAEFLGASLALYLLFGIPLLWAALVTGVVTFALLTLQNRGFRPLEIVIAALVGVVALSYLTETLFSHPDWLAVGQHLVTPWLGNQGSILLMVGIIGATVMPHAVYLHSGLTQRRIVPQSPAEAVRIHKLTRIDVLIAMAMAGLINMAMLYMAAAVFHASGHQEIADLTTAYQTLTPLLGGAAAFVFLISLLASGLSSSAVGTMAGQMIMQGFVHFTIPVWLRRFLTMLPAVVIIWLGVDPTMALVISQVVLSLALPIPVLALIRFTNRRDLMGPLVNNRLTAVSVSASAAIILFLNLVLLWQTFGLPLPLGLGGA